ncbi:hypothetical protein T484DRAFT_1836098 [Baffinella frigidus]|nr:hypothetical protein T484DRAFT_1836098 [Cryptophyta sp. CCMP2293]
MAFLQNKFRCPPMVAYIQRGGAPFTKKARVAVAAGAVACVVANSDKETFGMSFTDDGLPFDALILPCLPFDALNIPCVMISSDIADKLECAKDWSVTLVPAKPEQQDWSVTLVPAKPEQQDWSVTLVPAKPEQQDWSVTLVPAKPEQQVANSLSRGTKNPPPRLLNVPFVR